jgi:hypothetical protein
VGRGAIHDHARGEIAVVEIMIGFAEFGHHFVDLEFLGLGVLGLRALDDVGL